MKVIFLDVDGVLNSMEWMQSDECVTNGGIFGMDTEAVKLLKYIIQKTGANIVVSSSWRIGGITEGSHFYEELKRTDPSDTILNAVIDRTCSGGITDFPNNRNYIRGDQIQKWIDDNAFDGTFVILDDDDDMGHLIDHLVQTKTATGLLRLHVEQVIQKLNGI